VTATDLGFSALLKEYREAAGLTQEALAERARVVVVALGDGAGEEPQLGRVQAERGVELGVAGRRGSRVGQQDARRTAVEED